MKKIKLKFEDQSKNWNIWENKSEIERSIQRVKGTLPEMECAKQLTKILKKILQKKLFSFRLWMCGRTFL